MKTKLLQIKTDKIKDGEVEQKYALYSNLVNSQHSLFVSQNKLSPYGLQLKYPNNYGLGLEANQRYISFYIF